MGTRTRPVRNNRGMKLHIPPSWVVPLGLYEVHLRAADQAETTIARRLGDLAQIAREVGPDGPHTITGSALVAWAGEKVWATETRRNRRACARGFWEWAIANDFATENAGAALPSVPAGTPNPRPVPDRVYNPAVATATPRVALMLELGAELGLRRAEIAVIHVGRDLILDDDGYSLVVHGKGGSDVTLPVSDRLGRKIAAGAPGHSPLGGDSRTGWLFPGQDDGHLSPRRVGTLCAQQLQAHQSPDEVRYTAHKLRHRFGTRILRRTKDILTTRDAMRHRSVATTQIYCASDRAAVRAAINDAA